jgi:hypothetical protein
MLRVVKAPELLEPAPGGAGPRSAGAAGVVELNTPDPLVLDVGRRSTSGAR